MMLTVNTPSATSVPWPSPLTCQHGSTAFSPCLSFSIAQLRRYLLKRSAVSRCEAPTKAAVLAWTWLLHTFPILFIKGWIMCLLVGAHPLMCIHIISSIWEKRKRVAADKDVMRVSPVCPAHIHLCHLLWLTQRPYLLDRHWLLSPLQQTGRQTGGSGLSQSPIVVTMNTQLMGRNRMLAACSLAWPCVTTPSAFKWQHRLDGIMGTDSGQKTRRCWHQPSRRKPDWGHVLASWKRVSEDEGTLLTKGCLLQTVPV